ncbi:MAG: kinesin motor protein cin8 [Icmadophila ericetorum]|nr:kinesin motor protein cin8 [Icmadophila ericetorum]
MAILPKQPPTGLPPRKNTMRPPANPPSRAQSRAPSVNPRSLNGAVSPTDSLVSASTLHSHPVSHPMNSNKRKERDFDKDGEETNINVVVRCRGRSDREVRENSGVVVTTDGTKGKHVELSMGPTALSNKTYHFDKVFSPAADQAMIFEDVVTPLMDEMLQGYNCTIFAYGQTGTGKTYTMSGDMSDTLGLLSDSAGIIPRVLYSLFQKLEADELEYSVNCSFIELYNEELRDLLSVEENSKLKIFEDGQKKGHNATMVHGMEESHIKSAEAGIKLLQDGSHKRQVAATKCNDLSSRSHTVFTVTVYIKRTAENEEDFVNAGKLNLVDLAGSENIQRSGAENKRAAEAGLINKSLLTLGRVINALVDRSSHIPYRESKLTRLLQDSLGGRTKTCIIATISPAKSNLEETISTLDYAFRAKNIRNKPQINQTISKRTLLREFTAEIEKLKSELIATRLRNGVHLTNESFAELTGESESRRILSEELKEKLETMETHLRNKVQELFSLTSNFSNMKKDNEVIRQALDASNEILQKTEIVLKNTKQNLADETKLRKAHQATEGKLYVSGRELISTLDRTVQDVNGLHAKISRKSDLQFVNRTNWGEAQSKVSDVTSLVETRVDELKDSQTAIFEALSKRMQDFIHEELQVIECGQTALQAKVASFEESEVEVLNQTSTARDEMDNVLDEIKTLREDVKQKVGEGLEKLSAAAERISAGVISELEGFHTQLHTSYSSLSRDFKTIFEDVISHLNAQKAETNSLREQLAVATGQLLQNEAENSEKLESFLVEERNRAELDRQKLLSQITTMMDDSHKQKEERWTTGITSIREKSTTSHSGFEAASKQYDESMDNWSLKEDLLVEKVNKSREALKTKMKNDWTAVNEHNVSIQSTTKSIHEETIRVVDAQMKDVATQMQALDDFVKRAKSQNEDHRASHVQSLQRLGSSVKASQTEMSAHFSSAQIHITRLESDTAQQTASFHLSLPPLLSALRQPLFDLRTTIESRPLQEYIPTGSTPQKTEYTYPTILPRTEAHDKLLSTINNSSRTGTTTPILDLSPENLSPTKSAIYTDSPPTGEEGMSPVRPGSTGMGLQERNLNVNAAVPMTRGRASLNLVKPDIQQQDDEKTFSRSLMGPPPLKRVATESKLPQKNGRRGRAPEGRENIDFLGSLGTGRKLRSSPNA